jgi:hypothetical protein
VAGGEYDPTSTKVLHFVANPAAEIARLKQAAELDRLAAENQELKAALSKRPPAAAAAAGTPPTAAAAATLAAAAGGDREEEGDGSAVAAAVAAAEAKLTARKLAAAEKQVAALKEVFNKRVKAFRDAVRCVVCVCGGGGGAGGWRGGVQSRNSRVQTRTGLQMH